MNPWPVDPMQDDVTPWLAPNVSFVVLEGQVVLHDGSRAKSHVLNPSAASIWAEVDDHRTVGEIVDDLQRDTGADRELLDHDVKATLTQLLDDQRRGHRPGRALPLALSADVEHAVDVESWVEPSPPDLDHVDWLLTVGPVQALAVDLVVRTNHPETAAELGPALAALRPSSTVDAGSEPGSADAPAPAVISLLDNGPDHPPRFRRLPRRPSAVERREPRDPARRRASDEITQLAIDGTPGQLVLHAGAVERDGRVVVVAGDSGRGKSTLTAALVQRGLALPHRRGGCRRPGDPRRPTRSRRPSTSTPGLASCWGSRAGADASRSQPPSRPRRSTSSARSPTAAASLSSCCSPTTAGPSTRLTPPRWRSPPRSDRCSTSSGAPSLPPSTIPRPCGPSPTWSRPFPSCGWHAVRSTTPAPRSRRLYVASGRGSAERSGPASRAECPRLRPSSVAISLTTRQIPDPGGMRNE